ncbi:hypothetical protein GCM10028809_35780 [Spirosoma gilvum]
MEAYVLQTANSNSLSNHIYINELSLNVVPRFWMTLLINMTQRSAKVLIKIKVGIQEELFQLNLNQI